MLLAVRACDHRNRDLGICQVSVDLAIIGYRTDTGEAVLSVTHDGKMTTFPIDRRRLLVLLESLAEAFKRMEHLS